MSFGAGSSRRTRNRLFWEASEGELAGLGEISCQRGAIVGMDGAFGTSTPRLFNRSRGNVAAEEPQGAKNTRSPSAMARVFHRRKVGVDIWRCRECPGGGDCGANGRGDGLVSSGDFIVPEVKSKKIMIFQSLVIDKNKAEDGNRDNRSERGDIDCKVEDAAETGGCRSSVCNSERDMKV